LNQTNTNQPISKDVINKSLIPHEEEYTIEYFPFRKLNLYQVPNSKRTLNPELGV